MKTPSVSLPRASHAKSRAGLFAASEIAIMVFALAGGFWLINQIHSEITTPPEWSVRSTKACSERAVFKICLDPDGRSLWLRRRSSPLLQLNVVTGHVERTIPLNWLETLATSFSRDGSTCMICGNDGTVLLVREGEEPRTHQIAAPNDSFQDGALSHDGHVSLCVTANGHALGWNRDSEGDHELAYDFPDGSKIERIGLNSAGTLLVLGRGDGSVSFHNPLNGMPEGRTLHCESGCVSLAWSNDDRFLVVASQGGIVQAFDLATGRVVLESSGESGAPFGIISDIAISANGQRIAVANINSNAITVWDVETGKLTARLCGHDGLPSSLQFSPQSHRLYSGSYDGTIREWDLEKGVLRRIVEESVTDRLSDNEV